MEAGFSIFPVLLFLLFLFLLDSFKLVTGKILLVAIVWGSLSALLAGYLNTGIMELTRIPFDSLSRYFAPATEEALKSAFIFLMLAQKRIGFMIDAAVYGFAIGAGFALTENLFYLQTTADPNLWIWVIRGFGTAFMHGGCTSLAAVILIASKTRSRFHAGNVLGALLTAYVIHSAFNHFYVDPLAQTFGIIILLPVIFILVFRHNEKQLQNWLEIEFNSEIELLNMINKGQFFSTHSGEYLNSLKSRFPAETIVDMYCYISIYLELSIKAKRNIMLKESGLSPIIERDLQSKLQELIQLRKQIGKIGELTLSPLIRMNYRNLWKLNLLT